MPRRVMLGIVWLILFALIGNSLGMVVLPVRAASGPAIHLAQTSPNTEEQQEGQAAATPLPSEYLVRQTHPAMLIGAVVLLLIVLLGVTRLPHRQ